MAKSTKNNMLRTLDAESRSVLSAYVNFHLWGPHVQSSFKDESHLWLIRPLGTPLCNLRQVESTVGMGEMAEILQVLETMEYPHDHSELRCRTLSDIYMYNMFRSPIDSIRSNRFMFPHGQKELLPPDRPSMLSMSGSGL
jgi:hypothetical protein